jgi:transcriptional regulator with XRE-family HTH domain
MKEKRPTASKNFPDRLKSIRNEKGWSQGQLAKKLGIDPQTVSKYERGVIFPTVNMMINLAKAFEITLDDLVFDDRKIDLDAVKNQELIKRFYKVSQLSDDNRNALITMMDAVIKNQRLEDYILEDR